MSTSDVYVLTATAKQLKELLAAKNLPTYGSKANMRERLLNPSAKRKRVPKPKDARIAKRVATLHTSTRPCDSTDEVMRIGGCPRSMSVGQCTRRITLSPLSELSFDLWEHVLEFLSPLNMNLGFFQTCQALYALKKRVRRIVLKGRPRIPPTVVVRLLAGFASLTTVDLSYTSFTSQGILAIADALQTGTLVALTDLNLSHNLICGHHRICGLDHLSEGTYTDVGIKALAEALKVSSTLKSLNVGWNSLREGAALSIVSAARQQDKMAVLGLAQCDIGPAGAAELADYISFSSALTNLDLSNNRLCGLDLFTEGTYSSAGIAALAEGLLVSSALKKLVLARNTIGDGGASAFGQGLKDNKMLEELDLQSCKIGPAGAQGLAEGLFSSALKDLNLGFNHLGDKGAKALARALGSSALTSLNLQANHIGHTGATALAEALKVSSALKNLDLVYNYTLFIRGEPAQQLVAAALESKTLEVFSKVPIKQLHEECSFCPPGSKALGRLNRLLWTGEF